MNKKSPAISFFNHDISFTLKNKTAIKKWLIISSQKEKFILTELNFIFCSDEFLHNMNVEYLHHDTYTDVITFDYTEKKNISGEIFISVDRVKENALKYKTSFDDELRRVMIHGLLHLMGYDDKAKAAKLRMKAKEDFYLKTFR